MTNGGDCELSPRRCSRCGRVLRCVTILSGQTISSFQPDIANSMQVEVSCGSFHKRSSGEWGVSYNPFPVLLLWNVMLPSWTVRLKPYRAEHQHEWNLCFCQPGSLCQPWTASWTLLWDKNKLLSLLSFCSVICCQT